MIVPAVLGVSLAGYIAPIPILTRFFAIVLSPFQTALTGGEILSIFLFLCIVFLGVIHRRFWCGNLCPTGALLSLVSRLKFFGKVVAPEKCNHCSRCVDACAFGAIERKNEASGSSACTTCLACAKECKSKAISFNCFPRSKGNQHAETTRPEPRRRFLFGSVSVILAGLFAGMTLYLRRNGNMVHGETTLEKNRLLIRPPGSVPEDEFLKRCVRCGECLRACPNNALQPCSFDFQGQRLWTPQLVPDWSGCEPSCNNCGFVCPTKAIRALPLPEKRACRIGLAVVNCETCLPHALREDCRLCFDECHKAGYDAIEFMRIGTKVDEFGEPVEDSGFLAPVVLAEKCVGCGLCQTRCRAINAVQKHLMDRSAINVVAGNGHEDRLLEGSYSELRRLETERKIREQSERNADFDEVYLPDFLQ